MQFHRLSSIGSLLLLLALISEAMERMREPLDHQNMSPNPNAGLATDDRTS